MRICTLKVYNFYISLIGSGLHSGPADSTVSPHLQGLGSTPAGLLRFPAAVPKTCSLGNSGFRIALSVWLCVSVRPSWDRFQALWEQKHGLSVGPRSTELRRIDVTGSQMLGGLTSSVWIPCLCPYTCLSEFPLFVYMLRLVLCPAAPLWTLP